MSETIINTIEQMATNVLLADSGDFLVSVKIKPTNNIKVFADSDGEGGLTIEKCVRYNRALYKQIEDAALFPDGDFSLEVSSPGLSEPLKLPRQYHKNKGRLVEVIFNDDTVKTGTLLEVTDNDILIEETTGKGKKAETRQYLLPFDNIKKPLFKYSFNFAAYSGPQLFLKFLPWQV